MQITETHKNFPCGSKGRLTVKLDGGAAVAIIFTPVQKARKFCEANPDSPQGIEFANALKVVRRAELKTDMEALEAKIVDTVSDSVANNAAIDNLQRFLTENSDELFALGLRLVRDAYAASSSAVPAPPVLTGANPGNTAMVSAQRKLVKLHEAALADGAAAVQAIKTSRGNKYLNTCDDYKTALLAHFGAA